MPNIGAPWSPRIRIAEKTEEHKRVFSILMRREIRVFYLVGKAPHRVHHLLFCFFNLFYFIFYFILFLAVLGLHCRARALSSCGERGLLSAAVRRPLIAAASPIAEHGLQGARASVVVARGPQSTGSVAVAHRLRCSAACGILLDQGSNPCPLHWQADSQPLRHQGRPTPYS